MERDGGLPQYMRIAADIASRIAGGELPEGRKLSGKSTLSSEYAVSQETIRKALRLLADVGIVLVKESSGTVVASREKAQGYLESIEVREEQLNLRKRLRMLLTEYEGISRQVLDIGDRLILSGATPLPADRAVPNYEYRIPGDSDKVHMSLGDLRFWQCTGATVVAIRRGQSVQVSPGPYTELRAGDVLVYVGEPDAQRAVEQLFRGGRTERALYRLQEQIISAVHMKELEVITAALGARPGDITEVTALRKGMTNRSFRFTLKGKNYILRIPGEGTANFIDRRQEAAVYEAIRGRGLCDDPVYLNPENGLKVSRWLDNVRTCDPFREEDLVRAVSLLRKLHGMKLRVDHVFDLFFYIDFYESLWNGVPSVHEHYAETRMQIFSLREYIEAHRGPMCLTHIDFVPDNILFYTPLPGDGVHSAAAGRGPEETPEESIQLGDWEYAGMQDPHVDIAMFCIYSLYDREQIDHFIDLYFAGSGTGEPGCPDAVRIKIYCYVAVCGLLWSNWTEYKHLLGVEFGDYAAHQYRYAREYYQIVQEELGK